MTITKEERPYEILIRYNADGALSGAHEKRREVVVEDGEILSEKVKLPTPLDPASVSDVIASTEADLLAQINSLTDERDAAVAERDAAVAERDTAQARVAELEARLAEPEYPVEIPIQQAIRGLMRDGWITTAEAEAWAEGSALPTLIEQIIAAMPEAERVDAKVRAYKAINIRRDSPLLVAAAAASMPERTEAERAEVLRQSFAAWSAL